MSELRSAGLEANVFTHWTISPAPFLYFDKPNTADNGEDSL